MKLTKDLSYAILALFITACLTATFMIREQYKRSIILNPKGTITNLINDFKKLK